MCPNPSHDLTHALQSPLMRPDMFQCTPPHLDVPPPSQMHPARPSCAADQLQFLLTSDSISFYFPSILLFQLFSSFVSCSCTSLLVNLMNITTTSLRTSTLSHGARQRTSLSSGPYGFYQHEDSQYSGMSYAQPHLPYQVIRCHDTHFTHLRGHLIAAPTLSLRACAVV